MGVMNSASVKEVYTLRVCHLVPYYQFVLLCKILFKPDFFTSKIQGSKRLFIMHTDDNKWENYSIRSHYILCDVITQWPADIRFPSQNKITSYNFVFLSFFGALDLL